MDAEFHCSARSWKVNGKAKNTARKTRVDADFIRYVLAANTAIDSSSKTSKTGVDVIPHERELTTNNEEITYSPPRLKLYPHIKITKETENKEKGTQTLDQDDDTKTACLEKSYTDVINTLRRQKDKSASEILNKSCSNRVSADVKVCRQSVRHNAEIRRMVKSMVESMENVVRELHCIVGDMGGLIEQIDCVTDKLDRLCYHSDFKNRHSFPQSRCYSPKPSYSTITTNISTTTRTSHASTASRPTCIVATCVNSYLPFCCPDDSSDHGPVTDHHCFPFETSAATLSTATFDAMLQQKQTDFLEDPCLPSCSQYCHCDENGYIRSEQHLDLFHTSSSSKSECQHFPECRASISPDTSKNLQPNCPPRRRRPDTSKNLGRLLLRPKLSPRDLSRAQTRSPNPLCSNPSEDLSEGPARMRSDPSKDSVTINVCFDNLQDDLNHVSEVNIDGDEPITTFPMAGLDSWREKVERCGDSFGSLTPQMDWSYLGLGLVSEDIVESNEDLRCITSGEVQSRLASKEVKCFASSQPSVSKEGHCFAGYEPFPESVLPVGGEISDWWNRKSTLKLSTSWPNSDVAPSKSSDSKKHFVQSPLRTRPHRHSKVKSSSCGYASPVVSLNEKKIGFNQLNFSILNDLNYPQSSNFHSSPTSPQTETDSYSGVYESAMEAQLEDLCGEEMNKSEFSDFETDDRSDVTERSLASSDPENVNYDPSVNPWKTYPMIHIDSDDAVSDSASDILNENFVDYTDPRMDDVKPTFVDATFPAPNYTIPRGKKDTQGIETSALYLW